MQSVVSLSGLDIEPLRAKLAEIPQAFEKSKLYVSETDEKIVDESIRTSRYRAIKDSGLFDCVETYVNILNQRPDNNFIYYLQRNDVTHIIYDQGGFFKGHRDYLSLTSNLLEEHTMIICITPEEVATGTRGGETILHHRHSLTGDKHTKFSETVTPGSALVFRKDLEHEGSLIEVGEKHVVTTNLYAMRKDSSPDQVLLLQFSNLETSRLSTSNKISGHDKSLMHSAGEKRSSLSDPE